MTNRFERTELLLGKTAMERLTKSRVAVFGVGGVGGYIAEALVRSGIGAITLIDNDIISISDLNRQIIATESVLNKYKVDVAASRIKDINPDCDVETHKIFYLPDSKHLIDFSKFDYIADAIDTITGKITIIEEAGAVGVPVISSMGAGNKLNPEMFEISDIYNTSVCPLAKVIRKECKKRNIKKLKCVYSKEKPVTPLYKNTNADENIDKRDKEKFPPGSVSFVPSVAGLLMAGEIIKDIIYLEK